MDIADSGNIMPPKTTWFEPKLRSGLVIHKLSQKFTRITDVKAASEYNSETALFAFIESRNVQMYTLVILQAYDY